MIAVDGESRRLAWLMMMCLTLPKKHPVRVRELPWLTKQLAKRTKTVPSRNWS